MSAERPLSERRPVWIKGMWINDRNGYFGGSFGVEKLLLVSPEGEELWDWLIFAEDVSYVEREENDRE